MHQIEGSAVLQDTNTQVDCDDGEYVAWLQKHNLTKFFVPLKEYLGIDSIASCAVLDVVDIPRICQNILHDVKLQYGISLKDEVTFKKQLKMLVEKEAHAQQQSQSVRSDRIVRNLSEQEEIYFNKLTQKQEQLQSLLNDIEKEEKYNEQQCQNTLNKYKDFFDQLHCKLTEIYNSTCHVIQNAYETDYLSKQKKLKHDLTVLSQEMEKTKLGCIKSIQFSNMDEYMTNRSNLINVSQANVLRMKSVIDKLEKVSNHIAQSNKRLKDGLWFAADTFLEKCKNDVAVLDKLQGLQEWSLAAQHSQHPQRQAQSQQEQHVELKQAKGGQQLKQEKKEVNKKNKNKIERLTHKDLKDLCSEMVNLNDDKKFDFDPQSAAPVMLTFIFIIYKILFCFVLVV